MKENDRSVKSSRLERKIQQISDSIAQHRSAIGRLESQKAHWKFVLEHINELDEVDLHTPSSVVTAPPTGRGEFTSVRERKALIVEALKAAKKELTNGELFTAQIDAGMKTTKASHDSLISKMGRDPASWVRKGSKNGTYIYVP